MANEHILLVDDSEITIFKLKAALTRLGYTVTAQTNPVAALGWLEKTDSIPDLIISDVNMPQMIGYDFVRTVRLLPATARTPVLMLTSAQELEDKIAGLQAGADDYVSKNVTPTELNLRVQALLSRSQAAEGTLIESGGKTITVFSLRGGVGTTTIAVNMAIALAQLWEIETCLWDMNLSGGHCGLFLNLKPKRTPVILANFSEQDMDDKLIEGMLIKHESGIKLLPAPDSAAEAELINSKTVDLVWPYLQSHFPYMVIDAGNHFTDAVLTILDRSDMILLTLAPDLASVKSASDAMEIFTRMGIDLQKVVPVINHLFVENRLPTSKIIPVLRNRPAVEIAHNNGGIVQSILAGRPIVTTAPKADVSTSIISLSYRLSTKAMTGKTKNLSNPLLDAMRKMVK